MATWKLSDIVGLVNDKAFLDSYVLAPLEVNRIFRSGVMARNAALAAQIAANKTAHTFNLPHNDQLIGDPHPASDDPTDVLTPQKITGAKQVAVQMIGTHGVEWANLTAQFSDLRDPAAFIRALYAQYWATQHQKDVLSVIKGVLADNAANDSSSLIHNVASESIAGQSATTRISTNSIIDAKQLLGDHSDNLQYLVVHSKIFSDMEKLGMTTTTENSNFGSVPTFLGRYQIIQDDSVPVRAGTTDGLVYRCFLLAAGALFYEPRPLANIESFASEAQESAGGGAGVQMLINRMGYVIHPRGWAFTGALPPDQNTTTRTLNEAATSWDLVVDEKQVGIVALDVNPSA